MISTKSQSQRESRSESSLFTRLASNVAPPKPRPTTPAADCEKQNASDPCAGVMAPANPVETIRFSVLFDLESQRRGGAGGIGRLALEVFPDGNEEASLGEQKKVNVGCTGVHLSRNSVTQSLEVHFSQEWRLLGLSRGDLSRVITIAPNERVTVSVTRKRVDSFQRSTTETSEQTLSSQETSSEKEVYNVTRNSARSRNWGVDARITIPIEGVNLDIGGQAGGQVSSSITSAFNEVSEATQRSAEQLRTSTKTEVRETSESTVQTSTARIMQNPYGDRAIDVLLYEVIKDYCVTLRPTGACLAVRIDSSGVVFDSSFVRHNTGFLFDELLDRELSAELTPAVTVPTSSSSGRTVSERLAAAAEEALFYLFEKGNIFGVKPVANVDANDPANSFDAGLERDGFNDARNEGAVLQFATLNFFYAIYKDKKPVRGDRAVEMALSIHESVGERWLSLMDADGAGPDLEDLLDEKDQVDALRRLAGFAAYVKGAVKPLVAPSEQEREALQNERAAQETISRVVQHLKCYRHYYVERFLQHVGIATRGRTLAQYASAVLGSGLAPPSLDTSTLSVRSAYVDGTDVVIPCKDMQDIEWLEAQLKAMDPGWSDKLPKQTASKVSLLADGLHAVPVETPCVLSSLPARAAPIAEKVVVVDGLGGIGLTR